MANLTQVLNSNTIKVMETLEGCSIEEIYAKIESLFKSVIASPQEEETNRSMSWLYEYPPMLQAYHVQEILGICEASAYQVLHHRDCPTVRAGKRMVIPREDFW